MTPTAQAERTEWIAIVDGEIVGRGSTIDEAAQDATDNGYEDFSIQKLAPAGTYIL